MIPTTKEEVLAATVATVHIIKDAQRRLKATPDAELRKEYLECIQRNQFLLELFRGM